MLPTVVSSHAENALYGEHNLAYQEYPPKTAILAHVPSRSVCPWDIKNEFSTLKIGGGVKKPESQFHTPTPVCGNLHFLRYLSVYSKYWRSILAVYFGVYGRILRSIRPYTWSIRGLSTFHPCHHSHHLPLPLAFTHDPATPKHIVHTKEHHMSKAEDHKKQPCLMSHPKCQM